MEEWLPHINVLEMRAVVLALAVVLPQSARQWVVLMSDNVIFVAYLRNQGGTVSRVMGDLACGLVNLFTTRVNVKLLLYISPVPDPMAWKQDAFQHSWDHLSDYSFSPFTLIQQVLSKALLPTRLSLVLVVLAGLRKSGSLICLCWSRSLSNFH